MKLDEFDYALPPDRIAQEPAAERDGSRLMVLDRATGRIDHKVFRDLPSILRRGDLLVLNDSRVLPARLLARKPGGGVAEVLFLERMAGNEPPESSLAASAGAARATRPGGMLAEPPGVGIAPAQGEAPGGAWSGGSREAERWKALVRGFPRGGEVELPGGLRVALEGREPDGEVARVAVRPRGAVETALRDAGLPPLPPYIRREAGDPRLEADRARYQTVYAESPGAVAAPTAGLHFTRGLLDAIRTRGVAVEALTLHVGWGTFQPVRAERLEDHAMHAERFSIPGRLATAIASARGRGGRVVAVGTTVVRALEHAAGMGERGGAGEKEDPAAAAVGTETGPREGRHRMAESRSSIAGTTGPRAARGETSPAGRGVVSPGSGRCDLFIKPGHEFSVVDALVTNFHLPRSTLLVLVCAFAGRERILSAYAEAVRRGYRFYSYGDAMVIL